MNWVSFRCLTGSNCAIGNTSELCSLLSVTMCTGIATVLLAVPVDASVLLAVPVDVSVLLAVSVSALVDTVVVVAASVVVGELVVVVFDELVSPP